MTLWIALGLMAILAVALLLPPLLRRPPERPAAGAREHDLAVYRDQLAEVERDLERGTLDVQQAAAARTEIERRLLRARAREEKAGPGPRRAPLALAAVVAVIVPAGALLLYLTLGAPGLPDLPLAARQEAEARRRADAAEFARLTEQLAAKMEQNPGDARGWIMLGRSYRLLGRYGDSADAFRRAVAAAGGTEAAPPELLADLGEALVFEAGGTVTPAAQEMFGRAAADPGQIKARHYLATARAQAGDLRGALALWRGVEADSPPEAPWLEPLRQQIRQVAEQIGVAPEAVPPEHAAGSIAAVPGAPSREAAEAAARMSPEEREAFIRSMVDRLAARLRDNPDDAEGWARLGRAYQVLGDAAEAQAAFGKAAELWRAALARLPPDAPERAAIEERLRTVERRS